MLFTVSIPRTVAEDDLLTAHVEADTVEDAIVNACEEWKRTKPGPGDRFLVSVRVEVTPRPSLPLRSY